MMFMMLACAAAFGTDRLPLMLMLLAGFGADARPGSEGCL